MLGGVHGGRQRRARWRVDGLPARRAQPIAGPALDSRVLADAPTTCWASEDKDGKLTRIARYQGADAAARFAQEKERAKGSTVDKGNGLSVSTEGYLGKDVQAGDEAFCTTGDPLSSAGALVRRGDTLVYVSTTAAGDGAAAVPDIKIGDGQPDRLRDRRRQLRAGRQAHRRGA